MKVLKEGLQLQFQLQRQVLWGDWKAPKHLWTHPQDTYMGGN